MEYLEKVKNFFVDIATSINNFFNDLFNEESDDEIEESREDETYYECIKRNIINVTKKVVGYTILFIAGVFYVVWIIVEPILKFFSPLINLVLFICMIPIAIVIGIVYFIGMLFHSGYTRLVKWYKN